MSFAYRLSRFIRSRIVGQDAAVQEVVQALVPRLFNDIPHENTLAVFLLVGPSGTGKARMAETLAEFFLGDASRLHRMNCLLLHGDQPRFDLLASQFRDLGARPASPPPGVPAVDKVVLLEHIEKSSGLLLDFWNYLFATGGLRLPSGHALSFRRTLFLLKSAVGEKEVDRVLGVVGFGTTDAAKKEGEIRQLFNRSLEQRFPPRFLTSLTRVVHFRQIDRDDLKEILDRLFEESREMFRRKGIELRADEGVREHLLDRCLRKARFGGAKGLRRVIVDTLLYPVQDLLLSGRIVPPSEVWVRKGEKDLVFGIPQPSGGWGANPAAGAWGGTAPVPCVPSAAPALSPFQVALPPVVIPGLVSGGVFPPGFPPLVNLI